MSALTINLDLLGFLRSVRRLGEPDPAQAAVLAELSGADGISIQIRRDKKYIRDRDLYILKGVVKSKLTFEMPPTEDTIAKAMEIKPWMVIFAADHADSDSPLSPLDMNDTAVDYSHFSNQLTGLGINTGFFVQPDPSEIKAAAKAGASAILINCTPFTEAKTLDDAQYGLDQIGKAAEAAVKAGLAVNCGRGISYKNIYPLLELKSIDEFFVGNAVITRAVLVGMEKAIKEMKSLIRSVV